MYHYFIMPEYRQRVNVSKILGTGFLPKLQEQSAFGDHARIPRRGSPYLHGNSCFATISAGSSRLLQIPAIRFGLRESRSAYLGSSRFVLPRYSRRGNTRFEIQVSSRERSNLLPIAIAGALGSIFSYFKLRIYLFSVIATFHVVRCV